MAHSLLPDTREADAAIARVLEAERNAQERISEARAQAEAIPVRTIMPQVVEQDGKPWLTILSDAGYPVTAELLENVARG